MAANRDFISGLVSAKSLVNKIGAGLSVVALALCFIISWWWSLLLIGAIGIVLVVNSLCIVMPGNAGYQIVLGKLINKPVRDGLQFVVPFVSAVTEVNVKLQKHEDTNTMKNANLRDITLKYALTYQVNKNLVHVLHSAIGENEYIETALCPWLDAVMTQVVASKSYEDINGKLKELSEEIQDAYTKKVEAECQKIAGINLFSNMSVAITDVKFDEEYTKAISELAKAQKEIETVEAQRNQRRILAESNKEVKELNAEGEANAIKTIALAEAEALKIKGSSENEIKERLGEILQTHPELLKEVLAKNFPKVFGGNTMINLDDLLGK